MKRILFVWLCVFNTTECLYTTAARTITGILEYYNRFPSKKELAHEYSIDPNSATAQLLYDHVRALRIKSPLAQAQINAYLMQDYLAKDSPHIAAICYERLRRNAKNYFDASEHERNSFFYDQSLKQKILPTLLMYGESTLLGIITLQQRWSQISLEEKNSYEYPMIFHKGSGDLAVCHGPQHCTTLTFAFYHTAKEHVADSLYLILSYDTLRLIDIADPDIPCVTLDSTWEIQKVSKKQSSYLARNVHSFCVNSPTKRVTYLTNERKQFLATVQKCVDEPVKQMWLKPQEGVQSAALSRSGRYCLSLKYDRADVFDADTNMFHTYTFPEELIKIIPNMPLIALSNSGQQFCCASNKILCVVDLNTMSCYSVPFPGKIKKVEYIDRHDLIYLEFDPFSFEEYRFESGLYSLKHRIFFKLPGTDWIYCPTADSLIGHVIEGLSYDMLTYCLDRIAQFFDGCATLTFDQLLLVKGMLADDTHEIRSEFERSVYESIDPRVVKLLELERSKRKGLQKNLRVQVKSCMQKSLHSEPNDTDCGLDTAARSVINTVLKIDYLSLLPSCNTSHLTPSHSVGRKSLVIGNHNNQNCWWFFDHVQNTIVYSLGIKPWKSVRMIDSGMMVGLQGSILLVRKAPQPELLWLDPHVVQRLKKMDESLAIENKLESIKEQEIARGVIDASMSADGSLIAYIEHADESNSTSSLRLIKINTSFTDGDQQLIEIEPQQLPDFGSVATCALSPDGSKLFAIVCDENQQRKMVWCNTSSCEDSVTLLHLTHSEKVSALVSDTHGDHIAYAQENVLRVCDLEGAEHLTLIDPSAVKISPVSFSSCGRFIIYTVCTRTGSVESRIVHVQTGVSFSSNEKNQSYAFDADVYDDVLVRASFPRRSDSNKQLKVMENFTKKAANAFLRAVSWNDCQRLVTALEGLGYEGYSLLKKMMDNPRVRLTDDEYAIYQQFDTILRERFDRSVEPRSAQAQQLEQHNKHQWCSLL